MQKLITVPDVHGRTFWRSLKEFENKNLDIIFLGDYLDPYDFEPITKDEALEIFKEVLDFKKRYHGNITLLLGNHDLEYFAETVPCRMDYKNKEEIKKLFINNLDLFDIGCTRKLYERNYTFTHSCILKGWVDAVTKLDEYDNMTPEFKDCNTPDKIIEKLNYILHNDIEGIERYLNVISRSRGGRSWYGSPVWAHWNEIDNFDYEYKDWYQVFGHSQQFTSKMEYEIYDKGYTELLAPPIIEPFYACLDCKQLFMIEDGEVKLYPIKPETYENE